MYHRPRSAEERAEQWLLNLQSASRDDPVTAASDDPTATSAPLSGSALALSHALHHEPGLLRLVASYVALAPVIFSDINCSSSSPSSVTDAGTTARLWRADGRLRWHGMWGAYAFGESATRFAVRVTACEAVVGISRAPPAMLAKPRPSWMEALHSSGLHDYSSGVSPTDATSWGVNVWHRSAWHCGAPLRPPPDAATLAAVAAADAAAQAPVPLPTDDSDTDTEYSTSRSPSLSPADADRVVVFPLQTMADVPLGRASLDAAKAACATVGPGGVASAVLPASALAGFLAPAPPEAAASTATTAAPATAVAAVAPARSSAISSLVTAVAASFHAAAQKATTSATTATATATTASASTVAASSSSSTPAGRLSALFGPTDEELALLAAAKAPPPSAAEQAARDRAEAVFGAVRRVVRRALLNNRLRLRRMQRTERALELEMLRRTAPPRPPAPAPTDASDAPQPVARRREQPTQAVWSSLDRAAFATAPHHELVQRRDGLWVAAPAAAPPPPPALGPVVVTPRRGAYTDAEAAAIHTAAPPLSSESWATPTAASAALFAARIGQVPIQPRSTAGARARAGRTPKLKDETSGETQLLNATVHVDVDLPANTVTFRWYRTALPPPADAALDAAAERAVNVAVRDARDALAADATAAAAAAASGSAAVSLPAFVLPALSTRDPVAKAAAAAGPGAGPVASASAASRVARIEKSGARFVDERDADRVLAQPALTLVVPFDRASVDLAQCTPCIWLTGHLDAIALIATAADDPSGADVPMFT